MKLLHTILFVFVCIASTLATRNNNLRNPRFISGLLSGLGNLGGGYNRCGQCPEHHCRFDDAVVLGYCCGCKREMDKTPIRCSYHLNCPPSPQPLCSQYDYMMDCCC